MASEGVGPVDNIGFNLINTTVFFKALRRRETAGPSLEWHTIASKKENFPS